MKKQKILRERKMEGIMTWRRRNAVFIKFASIFLIVVFLYQNVIYAQDGLPVWSGSAKISVESEAVNGYDVPYELAEVKEDIQTDGDELIINIQDAHSNLGAQKSVAGILDSLVTNYNIQLIAIEGSEGFIDTTLISSYPKKEVREEAAGYLMERGKISAGEYFSINSEKPVALYGIEDSNLYMENVKAFRKTIDSRSENTNNTEGLIGVLEGLREHVFSVDLYNLSKISLLHRKGSIPFTEYWDCVYKLGQKTGVPYAGYKNLKVMSDVMKKEEIIDFNKADAQRKMLIEILSKDMQKKDLEDLVLKSVDFKLGRLSSTDFHSYIMVLADRYKVDPVGYNELIKYAEYLALYDSIDVVELFLELDMLERAIKNVLFMNETERKLDHLLESTYLLKDLFEAKLSSAAYSDVLGFITQTNKNEYTDFIKENYKRYNLTYKHTFDIGVIFENIPDALEFYRLAKERNSAMFRNTLKKMRQKGQKVAALVSGGFHTEGLTRIFNDQNLSYLVIVPKFEKDAPERPYIAVLTNKTEPYEKAVKSGEYLALFSSLAASKDIMRGLGIGEDTDLETRALALAILFGEEGAPVQNEIYIANIEAAYDSLVAEGTVTAEYSRQMLEFVRAFLGSMVLDEERHRTELVVTDLPDFDGVLHSYKFVFIRDVNTGRVDRRLVEIDGAEYAEFTAQTDKENTEAKAHDLMKAARRIRIHTLKKDEALQELKELLDVYEDELIRSIIYEIGTRIADSEIADEKREIIETVISKLKAKQILPAHVKLNDITDIPELEALLLLRVSEAVKSARAPAPKPDGKTTGRMGLFGKIIAWGLILLNSASTLASDRKTLDRMAGQGVYAAFSELQKGFHYGKPHYLAKPADDANSYALYPVVDENNEQKGYVIVVVRDSSDTKLTIPSPEKVRYIPPGIFKDIPPKENRYMTYPLIPVMDTQGKEIGYVVMVQDRQGNISVLRRILPGQPQVIMHQKIPKKGIEPYTEVDVKLILAAKVRNGKVVGYTVTMRTEPAVWGYPKARFLRGGSKTPGATIPLKIQKFLSSVVVDVDLTKGFERNAPSAFRSDIKAEEIQSAVAYFVAQLKKTYPGLPSGLTSEELWCAIWADMCESSHLTPEKARTHIRGVAEWMSWLEGSIVPRFTALERKWGISFSDSLYTRLYDIRPYEETYQVEQGVPNLALIITLAEILQEEYRSEQWWQKNTMAKNPSHKELRGKAASEFLKKVLLNLEQARNKEDFARRLDDINGRILERVFVEAELWDSRPNHDYVLGTIPTFFPDGPKTSDWRRLQLDYLFRVTIAQDISMERFLNEYGPVIDELRPFLNELFGPYEVSDVDEWRIRKFVAEYAPKHKDPAQYRRTLRGILELDRALKAIRILMEYGRSGEICLGDLSEEDITVAMSRTVGNSAWRNFLRNVVMPCMRDDEGNLREEYGEALFIAFGCANRRVTPFTVEADGIARMRVYDKDYKTVLEVVERRNGHLYKTRVEDGHIFVSKDEPGYPLVKEISPLPDGHSEEKYFSNTDEHGRPRSEKVTDEAGNMLESTVVHEYYGDTEDIKKKTVTYPFGRTYRDGWYKGDEKRGEEVIEYEYTDDGLIIEINKTPGKSGHTVIYRNEPGFPKVKEIIPFGEGQYEERRYDNLDELGRPIEFEARNQDGTLLESTLVHGYQSDVKDEERVKRKTVTYPFGRDYAKNWHKGAEKGEKQVVEFEFTETGVVIEKDVTEEDADEKPADDGSDGKIDADDSPDGKTDGVSKMLIGVPVSEGIDREAVASIITAAASEIGETIEIVYFTDTGDDVENTRKVEHLAQEKGALMALPLKTDILARTDLEELLRQHLVESGRQLFRLVNPKIADLNETRAEVMDRNKLAGIMAMLAVIIPHVASIRTMDSLDAYNKRMTGLSGRTTKPKVKSSAIDCLKEKKDEKRIVSIRSSSLGEAKLLAEAHRERVRQADVKDALKLQLRIVLDKDDKKLVDSITTGELLKKMELDDMMEQDILEVIIEDMENAKDMRQVTQELVEKGYIAENIAIVDNYKKDRSDIPENVVVVEYKGIATSYVYDAAVVLMTRRNVEEESLSGVKRPNKSLLWFILPEMAGIDVEELRQEIESYREVLMAA